MEGIYTERSCFTARLSFSGNDDNKNDDNGTASAGDDAMIPIRQQEEKNKKLSSLACSSFVRHARKKCNYTSVLVVLSCLLCLSTQLSLSNNFSTRTNNKSSEISIIGGNSIPHNKVSYEGPFVRRASVKSATEKANNLFSHGTEDENDSNHSSNVELIAMDESICTVECCRSLLIHSAHEDDNQQRLLEESDKGEDDNSWVKKVPFALQMCLIVMLILLSALFSGLTLGLMGLDKTGLEIVMEGDDPDASKAARKIYPIRANGNLLLCTLLLGNVAVNAMLSILMADITGGIIGFFVSTLSIVIFGEILPQAACSRYALEIGSRAIPLVRVIQIMFWPISAPIALALDKMLGHELGNTYSKAEMNKLLEIHVKEGRFNQETGTAMAGALKYQDVTVKEVMTPLEHTFMLDAEEKFSFETITKVFKTGFSRIPVYEVSVNNIIGLLFVKDLIFIDPDDETPVKNFVQIFGRGAHVVWPDDTLGDVLRKLKGGHSHMALVRDVNNDDDTQDPFYEIKGIVTLEDIIEIILGDEIVDETDAWVDGNHKVKVDRDADFDWAKLRLLDSKIVDETLSQEEVRAISAHLRTNHGDTFQLVSEKQLIRMIGLTPVAVLPASEMDIGGSLPENLLYEKGKPCNFCTLILSGKITVLAGSDNFRSVVSSWNVLAANALSEKSYAPDFNAYVTGESCRCLIFTQQTFLAAMDSSAVEKLSFKNKNIALNRSPSSNNIQTNNSFTSSNDKKNYELSSVTLDLNIDNTSNTISNTNNDNRVLSKSLDHKETSTAMTSSDLIEKEVDNITSPTKRQREAVEEHRSKLLRVFYRKSSREIKEQGASNCTGDLDKKPDDVSDKKKKDTNKKNSIQDELSNGGNLRPRSTSISRE